MNEVKYAKHAISAGCYLNLTDSPMRKTFAHIVTNPTFCHTKVRLRLLVAREICKEERGPYYGSTWGTCNTVPPQWFAASA